MMKNQYVESKMDFFSGMKKIRIRNYVWTQTQTQSTHAILC